MQAKISAIKKNEIKRENIKLLEVEQNEKQERKNYRNK